MLGRLPAKHDPYPQLCHLFCPLKKSKPQDSMGFARVKLPEI
ncbi:hypothetical protein F385_1119 [Pantoea agglomerans 299R]|nr:hypothetical protein F385_1119 [Pantoea agglomerans 299R]